MKILANKRYFVLLPKVNKAYTELYVDLLRKVYPKELKYAQISSTDAKWHVVGVLTERTP